VIKEDTAEVVVEIPLGGIPRTTVLSADGLSSTSSSTKMLVETVDLMTRKVISSFPLTDGRSIPRIDAQRGAAGVFPGSPSNRAAATCIPAFR